jgi:peroxiredoxin Q/BCP
MTQLKIGDKAPSIELPASDESSFKLESLKGKRVVVYFYPKDSTPGCTIEAKDFRDLLPRFHDLNTEVIGISKDTLRSHSKFIDSCELPFLLLSDKDNDVCERYGVWQQKAFMGRKFMGIVRSTFLIDEKGNIANIWYNCSVPGHVAEVLKYIEEKPSEKIA